MNKNGKLSLLAVASLILGLLSFVGWSVLTGIPALILGYISKRKIRRSDGKLEGKAMSLGGIVMGYTSIVLLIASTLYSHQVDSELKAIAEKISAEEQASGSFKSSSTIK